jgi:hypothetical protein
MRGRFATTQKVDLGEGHPAAANMAESRVFLPPADRTV